MYDLLLSLVILMPFIPVLIACLVLYVFMQYAYLALCRYVPCLQHDLSGKAVLVTGCDCGFGRALVRDLDRKGCLVFANCLTQQGADSITASSSARVVPVVFDVSSSEQVSAAFDTIQQSLKEFDVKGLWALVNNAGISKDALIEHNSLDNIRDMMNVNFFGMVNMCKVFIPLLRPCKGSRIVNVTSAAGRSAIIGMGGYAASKHASEAFSDTLRRELRPSGIRVSIIEPGFFKTPMVENATEFIKRQTEHISPYIIDNYGSRFFENLLRARTSTNDKAGNPQVVVDALVQTCSDRYPLHRIVLGVDALTAGLVLAVLPSYITDTVLPLIFHLRQH